MLLFISGSPHASDQLAYAVSSLHSPLLTPLRAPPSKAETHLLMMPSTPCFFHSNDQLASCSLPFFSSAHPSSQAPPSRTGTHLLIKPSAPCCSHSNHKLSSCSFPSFSSALSPIQAGTHLLMIPSAPSFSHANYQLASCFFPSLSSAHSSIKAPRWRSETHLQEGNIYPFNSCVTFSRPSPFSAGRLNSSADQENTATVGEDGNTIVTLEHQLNNVAVDEDDNSIEILEDREKEAKASSSDVIPVCVEIIGRNKRRISASIPIELPLEIVWKTVTDYERLAEFLPGLAVNQVQEQWENGARLFQIGEQNLALGVKFRAKCVMNVYERPVEALPCGIRRDVDFEMIEGDFKFFSGTWRMEQTSTETMETSELPASDFAVSTCLSYKLEVQPEIWLPVGLVQGRLSKEIQRNLVCFRNEALRRHLSLHVD